MAHESFEDADVAEVMNDRFVNVKVDREERPDVDAIYMDAVQALTGQRRVADDRLPHRPTAGPFYGGTYFPQGGPAGHARLRRASWTRSRTCGATGATDVVEQADQLFTAMTGNTLRDQLVELEAGAVNVADATAVLDAAEAALAERFDAALGGFGPAPKFPPAMASTSCCGGTCATAGPRRSR